MRGVGQSRALAPALPAGASRPATDDLRPPTWTLKIFRLDVGPTDGCGESVRRGPLPPPSRLGLRDPRPTTSDLRLGLRRFRGSTRTDGRMRGVGRSRALAPALPAGAWRPATDDVRRQDPDTGRDLPERNVEAMATVRALEGHTCATLNFRSAFHLKISSPESGPNCPVVVWGPT